jgi:hypothetical protein
MDRPDTLATDGELEQRRRRVVRYRLRGLSLAEIGQRLAVSEATISRDLNWVRAHRREVYGAKPTLDLAEFIGESMALFDESEATALTLSTSAHLTTRERLRSLDVAMAARVRKIELLRDTGVIARAHEATTNGLPSASEIRAALLSADIDPTDPKTYRLDPFATAPNIG